jgi:hypothetical protein
MPARAARSLRAGRWLPLLVAALALLSVLPRPAAGERRQKGNLIVAVDGGISPVGLPRDHPAPIALDIGGRVGTVDGSPLPRMTKIKLVLGGRGRLSTRGLPVCPRARLRNADTRQALARCGPALVGRGSLDAVAFIPHQAPFPIHSRLLAFNGRTAGGGPAVWVHTFVGSPPVSVILPFVIRRQGKALHTVLSMRVPRSVGALPHLSGFEMTLYRRFIYRGEARSYLSASCPASSGFTEGFITFARASYDFADGRRLGVEAVRRCTTQR